ncbi:HesB/YadR/YfhF family protein [Oceanobacillus massiliensis]|uniref:HesB/YadR/YfhF family protein n=1 Tax=Oceanobacillus massiliensis TaxID=1465765 RepID=UPI0002884B12|nr:hypothetical protein [Oceanobacillus massiliensis]
MKLEISNEAAKWYREELDAEDATYLRFFVRYGGVGGKIPGFSLGIKKDDPKTIHSTVKAENIHFYIEESDIWYFEDSDLVIDFDKQQQEPVLKYV